ncbi:GL10593 [Drosophila persimilis]|uniref:GL10593 n=1 Tax=Drosophila persimilis TaxID=7234 RepID=B4GB40_DROPE|nr:GL10593 [Drosophila persimilis]
MVTDKVMGNIEINEIRTIPSRKSAPGNRRTPAAQDELNQPLMRTADLRWRPPSIATNGSGTERDCWGCGSDYRWGHT